MPSQRLTVKPLSSFSTNVWSRVSLTLRAISSNACSHEMSSQRSEPGRRTCGLSRRRSLSMSCSSEAPFGQSVPQVVHVEGDPDVYDLRDGVLGLIAQSMNDDAAAHRAVRADAARLGRACDL